MSCRRCGGKLFHTRGPATLKLRSPKLFRVRGTKHVLTAAERRGRRTVSVTSRTSSARYAGVRPASDWCTRHATLYIVDSSTNRKPVQLTQHRRDVIASTSPGDQTCGGVLDRLDLPKKAVWHTVQQRVAVVETAANEILDRCSGGDLIAGRNCLRWKNPARQSAATCEQQRSSCRQFACIGDLLCSIQQERIDPSQHNVRQTKAMLQPLQQEIVVDAVECWGQVQETKQSDFFCRISAVFNVSDQTRSKAVSVELENAMTDHADRMKLFSSESSCAVRLARHSLNAWARHVERVESSRAKWNLSHTKHVGRTAGSNYNSQHL